MNKQEYTFTLYTENNLGLLGRLAEMFSRRRINIEMINVAASEIAGIHRFTIVVFERDDVVKKLSQQLSKQVDVLQSFYHTNDEILWHEPSLYKVTSYSATHIDTLNALLQQHNAKRLPAADENMFIFGVNGTAEETNRLLQQLKPLGLNEFVKSARVAVSKRHINLHEKLLQFADNYPVN